MKRTHDKLLLKKILTRTDQLGRLKKQIHDGPVHDRPAHDSSGSPSSLKRLKQQSKKKIDEIDTAFKSHEFSGPLTGLLKRYRLSKHQLVILFALLRQRLIHADTTMTGRELLKLIFDDAYGILRGMPLIDASSLLLSTGMVIPETTGTEEDLLDAKFSLSDRVFSMIYNTFATEKRRKRNSPKISEIPYRNNLSYLMDLRKLSLLYQKRTTKVFNYDYWDEIGLGVADSVTGINAQLDKVREQIRVRLERTESLTRLHTWNFIQQFMLTEEETVILVTLLFQEITEGNAYLNAVDLLRLTARNEQDLIRRRRFFAPQSTLVKNKIITLEEMVNRKELTAEVSMPNWSVETMLTGIKKSGGTDPEIDADARLDFHKYLNNLDSSEDFLDDLEN